MNSQQQEAAQAGLTWHLVHLTAGWAAGGVWVADLRMEASLDKLLLAGTDPIEAFGDETGYARLAERLGAARQRPAVAEPTLNHVIKPLRAHLAEQRAAGAQPLAGEREIRVQSDHPTTPAATLFVIAEDPSAVDRAPCVGRGVRRPTPIRRRPRDCTDRTRDHGATGYERRGLPHQRRLQ